MKCGRLPWKGALRGYLRCRHRLTVISPGGTLIVDDVGNRVVVERAGKRRHDAGVNHASRPCTLHPTTIPYDAPTATAVALVFDVLDVLDLVADRWLKPQMYAATADT